MNETSALNVARLDDVGLPHTAYGEVGRGSEM